MTRGDNTKTLLARIEAPMLVAVPLVLGACAWFDVANAALLTTIAVLLCLAWMLLAFDRSRPAPRQIMPIVVLASLAIAGRILLAALPYLKPVSAICILAGAVYGRRSGFLAGALAALGSNFFFAQGLWTPWQMYAWGLVGYLSGVFADRGWLKNMAVVLAWGFLSGLLYGFILNSWFVVGYVHPLTLPSIVAAYGAGLTGDVTHGLATVAFLAVLYLPWRKKLERIQQKYA